MDNRDIMPIAVRAFVQGDGQAARVHGKPQAKPGASNYTLIFDTETATDAAQHIRFGT